MIRSYIILFKNNQFRSLSPLISIMHFLPQEKASCSLHATKYMNNSKRLENGSLLSWGSCLLFHWENKSNQKSPKLPPTLPPICYWSIYPAFLPVYPYLRTTPPLTHWTHPFSPQKFCPFLLPHQVPPIPLGSVGTAYKYTVTFPILKNKFKKI